MQYRETGLQIDNREFSRIRLYDRGSQRAARHRRVPSNRIVRVAVAPGSVTTALEPLRMARKLDPYRETTRRALEPWQIETALARLNRTLNPAEQRTIVQATRTPHKVKWPEWWSERP